MVLHWLLLHLSWTRVYNQKHLKHHKMMTDILTSLFVYQNLNNFCYTTPFFEVRGFLDIASVCSKGFLNEFARRALLRKCVDNFFFFSLYVITPLFVPKIIDNSCCTTPFFEVRGFLDIASVCSKGFLNEFARRALLRKCVDNFFFFSLYVITPLFVPKIIDNSCCTTPFFEVRGFLDIASVCSKGFLKEFARRALLRKCVDNFFFPHCMQ
jgi:hypothetical protein